MDPRSEADPTWKDEVLRLLQDHWAARETFSLGDVYQFRELLSAKHPENFHIDEKIRQTLQVLRDLGELKFVDDDGHYALIRPSPVPNDPTLHERTGELRAELLAIRDLDGQVLPSSVLQGLVKGFGSQKGIYKPSGSNHALWVRQTSNGPYQDEKPVFHPDGTWTYRYSPEGRSGQTDLDLDTNRALIKCSEDRIPVGVFRQVETSSKSRAYEVLGLAMVEQFDGTHFLLRGEGVDVTATPIVELPSTTFVPFDLSSAKLSHVSRVLRDRRFSTSLRKLYHDKCSLCNLGYRVWGHSVGLEAAHIIPVEEKGNISDLRNGILLCSNHHELFDSFAWTIDHELKVKVAPEQEFRESAIGNHILKLEGKTLSNLPDETGAYPAREAVDWRMTKFDSLWGGQSPLG